jgi:hypothetical protein
MSGHYVYVLKTQTAVASSVLIFRTLPSVYRWIRQSSPIELHIVPFDMTANDLAERRPLHENKPYKIAWNADKTWIATVTRQEIIEDDTHPVSSIQQSFHIHHNVLFKGQ